jgi:branched-chain amino acid transport system ATP-binding protein
LLKLKELAGRYGEVQVIHKISLEVKEGKISAIIGSNGAGKSTIISLISGLMQPLSGRIELEGADITGLPPHEIAEKGISQVPEGRGIFALMSVRENLIVGATIRRAKGDREKNMKRVFDIFPVLYNRRDQKAGSLSGGEQQMLAIGRGLMSNPKLLILDEPSLGLAPLLTQEMFHVLTELNKEGLTILLVDQNLTQTLKISHYGYVLENGRIALEGTSEELLASDRTKRAYLGM